jgi:signal peptidase II
MQAARGASLNSSGPDHHPTGKRPLGLFFGVALVAYALDLVTKVLAVERLSGRDPVPVLGELLQLTLVRNPGAAFSTGTSYTVVLTVVAIVAVGVVLFLSRRTFDRVWAFGLGCLLGGVLGNLTDRIFREPGPLRGHVVDFLQLPNWPVFNVADICINVAAGVIILQAVRGVSHTGERESRKEDEAAGS